MFKDIFASSNSSELVYNIGMTLLIIIISAFILRWLWNKVLVPHITFVKPLGTLLDAFLMSIAIAVIRGS
jgi:retron-type reverse transcriptase